MRVSRFLKVGMLTVLTMVLIHSGPVFADSPASDIVNLPANIEQTEAVWPKSSAEAGVDLPFVEESEINGVPVLTVKESALKAVLSKLEDKVDTNISKVKTTPLFKASLGVEGNLCLVLLPLDISFKDTKVKDIAYIKVLSGQNGVLLQQKFEAESLGDGDFVVVSSSRKAIKQGEDTVQEGDYIGVVVQDSGPFDLSSDMGKVIDPGIVAFSTENQDYLNSPAPEIRGLNQGVESLSARLPLEITGTSIPGSFYGLLDETDEGVFLNEDAMSTILSQKLGISLDTDNMQALPVFDAVLSKEGNKALVMFSLNGEKFEGISVDNLVLVKAFSSTYGEFFTPVYSASSLTDGTFVVVEGDKKTIRAKNSKVRKGDFIVLCIEDNGRYDLNTASGIVSDPSFVARKEKSLVFPGPLVSQLPDDVISVSATAVQDLNNSRIPASIKSSLEYYEDNDGDGDGSYGMYVAKEAVVTAVAEQMKEVVDSSMTRSLPLVLTNSDYNYDAAVASVGEINLIMLPIPPDILQAGEEEAVFVANIYGIATMNNSHGLLFTKVYKSSGIVDGSSFVVSGDGKTIKQGSEKVNFGDYMVFAVKDGGEYDISYGRLGVTGLFLIGRAPVKEVPPELLEGSGCNASGFMSLTSILFLLPVGFLLNSKNR